MIAADIDPGTLGARPLCAGRASTTRRRPSGKAALHAAHRFEFQIPEGDIGLLARCERFPYVPNDPALRDERCYEAYNIQVHWPDEAPARVLASRKL
jgi:hypothetical protein